MHCKSPRYTNSVSMVMWVFCPQLLHYSWWIGNAKVGQWNPNLKLKSKVTMDSKKNHYKRNSKKLNISLAWKWWLWIIFLRGGSYSTDLRLVSLVTILTWRWCNFLLEWGCVDRRTLEIPIWSHPLKAIE